MCYNFVATVKRFFTISYLPIKAIEFLTAFMGCPFKDLSFDTKIIDETLRLAPKRTTRRGVYTFGAHSTVHTVLYFNIVTCSNLL